MRKAFVAAVVLLGLLSMQVNAEILRTKEGLWYTVVDLFNNPFMSWFRGTDKIIVLNIQ